METFFVILLFGCSIYFVWTFDSWLFTYFELFIRSLVTVWIMLIGATYVLISVDTTTIQSHTSKTTMTKKVMNVLFVCVENDCIFCKVDIDIYDTIPEHARLAYTYYAIDRQSLRILNGNKNPKETARYVLSLLETNNIGWPSKTEDLDVVVFIGNYTALTLGMFMREHGYWSAARFVFVKETPIR